MARLPIVLLAPLLAGCSIDLLVTEAETETDAPSDVAAIGQWGNVGDQDPWHPEWGLPLATTEPSDGDANTVGFNRLARTTGTIRLDADGEALGVAVSMQDQNTTDPAFGDDGTLTAVLLRGPADALSLQEEIAGIDAGASAEPPPFLELTAVALDQGGSAIVGRYAGGDPIAASYDDAAFGIIPGSSGSRQVSMPGEQDGSGSVVLPMAVRHAGARTWMAGAYYNGTLRLGLATNQSESVFLDGEQMSAGASIYFFDQGNGWRGNGFLVVVDDDDDEVFHALQLDSQRDTDNGAVNARGYQELTSLDLQGNRALVGGRIAGYARVITDADDKTPIAVHELNEPVTLEHFAPAFFELTYIAGEDRSFGYVWHWDVSQAAGPNVRGDIRAVGFDGEDALGCGTWRGDAEPIEPRWMLVRRRDGVIERPSLPGDPAGHCTAMDVTPAGIFIAGVVLEGAEPKGRVMLIDRDDLRLLASFDVPAPASHIRSVAVVEDGAYVAGAFRSRLDLDEPLEATGGDGDWDFFALRWRADL